MKRPDHIMAKLLTRALDAARTGARLSRDAALCKESAFLDDWASREFCDTDAQEIDNERHRPMAE